MKKYIAIPILALCFILSGCLNDDEPSCAYTPQGKTFSACFNYSSDKSDDGKTACSNLSGAQSDEQCNTSGVSAFCSKGKIDQELTNVGSTPIDLGELEFSFVGGNTADLNDYCSNTLSGTYITP